jgi:hypothetical protein
MLFEERQPQKRRASPVVGSSSRSTKGRKMLQMKEEGLACSLDPSWT